MGCVRPASSSLARDQCDQIGRFIVLWATFQSLWRQLICPNLLHCLAIFVKVSKSLIFLVKLFWRDFYRHLAIFYWSHWSRHYYYHSSPERLRSKRFRFYPWEVDGFKNFYSRPNRWHWRKNNVHTLPTSATCYQLQRVQPLENRQKVVFKFLSLASVTRFGEILPLRQNPESLGQFLRVYLLCAKFWTYFGKFCLPLGKFSLMKTAKFWKMI